MEQNTMLDLIDEKADDEGGRATRACIVFCQRNEESEQRASNESRGSTKSKIKSEPKMSQ